MLGKKLILTGKFCTNNKIDVQQFAAAHKMSFG